MIGRTESVLSRSESQKAKLTVSLYLSSGVMDYNLILKKWILDSPARFLLFHSSHIPASFSWCPPSFIKVSSVKGYSSGCERFYDLSIIPQGGPSSSCPSNNIDFTASCLLILPY